MNKFRFYTLLCLGLALAACKKSGETPVPDYGTDYFLFIDSMEQEFKVTYTEYNIFGKEITETYLKEVFVDYPETERTDDFKIFSYKKNELSEAYKLDSVSSGFKTREEYVKDAHGNLKLRLSFPLNEDKSWDVNAYNTLDTLYTEMIWYDESYMVQGKTYDQTLKAETENQVTFISHKEAYEIYARDFGLLESMEKDLGFQPGEDTIGYVVKKTRLAP